MMIFFASLILLFLGALALVTADDTEGGAYAVALGCVLVACGLVLTLLAVVLWWRA